MQLQLDGFTINWLKPDPTESWLGWPSLKEEATRAWDLYVDVGRPQEITRLGMRYINQVVIPVSPIDLDDYFTAPPSIPKALPYQDFGHFFSRVEVSIPQHNAKAIITQMPSEQEASGSIIVILDIEVLKVERMPLNSGVLWETLDQFRELKNTIFEASLHQKTKDLFQ